MTTVRGPCSKSCAAASAGNAWRFDARMGVEISPEPMNPRRSVCVALELGNPEPRSGISLPLSAQHRSFVFASAASQRLLPFLNLSPPAPRGGGHDVDVDDDGDDAMPGGDQVGCN